MKTLAYIKYFLGTAASLFMLSACQKALNNTIPEGTPRRQFYNNQIMDYLILPNDSVWVTQRLDKNSLVFRVGFDFKKDKTVTLYKMEYIPLTLIDELELAKLTFPDKIDKIDDIMFDIYIMRFFNSDAQIRIALITVPGNVLLLNSIQKFFPVTLVAPTKLVEITEGSNTYGVQGDFNSSLTFFSNSFLSDLKVSKNFDFDFLINSYNRDSIVMTSYYTQPNKVAILKPVALTSVVPHLKAIGIISSLPFLSEIKVNGKILAGETAAYIKNKFNESYDHLNKNLNFVVKATETEHSEFKGLTALKAIEATDNFNPKPAAGTVLAKFIAYDPSVKGFNNTIPVEILVK